MYFTYTHIHTKEIIRFFIDLIIILLNFTLIEKNELTSSYSVMMTMLKVL